MVEQTTFATLAGEIYDELALAQRLQSHEFALATYLRPENFMNCLRHHAEPVRSYLALAPEVHRATLAGLLAKMWKYSPASINAISTVPRESFVPKEHSAVANLNGVNVIRGKTAIESPWLLAYGATTLGLMPGHRVLVLGAGTGYSAALSAAIVTAGARAEVLALEIDPDMAIQANTLLAHVHAENCFVLVGNALQPEALGKFDAIWPTLSTPGIPAPWIRLLKEGGRLCAYLPKDLANDPVVFDPSAELPNVADSSNLHQELSLVTYSLNSTILRPVAMLSGLENAPFELALSESSPQPNDFAHFAELEDTLCSAIAANDIGQ